jgi:hypothetical protein
MPLTDLDIEFTYAGTPGVPLVWVIDGDCVYDLPLSVEHSEIFLSADEVLDISSEYPDHNGIVVRLLQAGETRLELATTEYFGSILLSNPQVLNLVDYPYGRYVVSPHAKFDGEKFIILNRDVSGLSEWSDGAGCCPPPQ